MWWLWLGYLDDPTTVVLALAAASPRTQREKLSLFAAVHAFSLWDDAEVFELRQQWEALQQQRPYLDDYDDKQWPDPKAFAAELSRFVKQRKLGRAAEQLRAWQQTRPLPSGPAFGVEGCHAESDEPSMSAPQPPPSAASERPRSFQEALLVRVAEDGSPSWVGALGAGNGERFRACWALHDGAWTPAKKGEELVARCVVVPCRNND